MYMYSLGWAQKRILNNSNSDNNNNNACICASTIRIHMWVWTYNIYSYIAFVYYIKRKRFCFPGTPLPENEMRAWQLLTEMRFAWRVHILRGLILSDIYRFLRKKKYIYKNNKNKSPETMGGEKKNQIKYKITKWKINYRTFSCPGTRV